MPEPERTQLTADTVEEVVVRYHRYLSRNSELATHYTQYLKREKAKPKDAEAEAVIFSWLRDQKREPEMNEDTGTGGPDFRCDATGRPFLVEVTSLDSEKLSERSGLPLGISGPGAQAYGLITEKLKSVAKGKAKQLSGHSVPTVLAITATYDYSGILLDNLAAEYLMTSALSFNVPVGGGQGYHTTDLKDSVFKRLSPIVDHKGAPIISDALRSIGAILLVAIHPREMNVVGLLHPSAVNPFDPQLLPMVPFVRFTSALSHKNIATEWVQVLPHQHIASFRHRRIE